MCFAMWRGGRTCVSMNDSVHLVHAGRRRIAGGNGRRYRNRCTSYGKLGTILRFRRLATRHSLRGFVAQKTACNGTTLRAIVLVLTPSCDLVKGRCEPTLIVASCEGTERLAKKLSLSLAANKAEKDCETVISKALTIGSFSRSLLPLPSFPSRLPTMIANLKAARSHQLG